MSTTTISVRTSTDDVEMAALRRREADAREAARQAARRAEEQRRREEAVRRRIKAANRTITEQEARFQDQTRRLDDAARRLPDVTLGAPKLPGLTSEIAQDPGKLEQYARSVTATVSGFSRKLDQAIAEGDRLLLRRIARAAAWRGAADLERQLGLRAQISQELATRLNDPINLAMPPQKPGAEAELEVVEAYGVAMAKALADMNRLCTSLSARLEARERAKALGGQAVLGQSAADTQARYEAERLAGAQAALRVAMDSALARSGFGMEDLPGAVNALIQNALAQATAQDQSERVIRWIVREKQRQDGVQRALTLMQEAPELVHDNSELSQRWFNILAELQRVASGLAEFTPSLDHEHAQLRADALRNLKMAFTKADWLQAMSAQGFEIFEREDGDGLVLVDLDHPEVWLEAAELESEQGGFGATLELKTEANSPPADEAAVTTGICAKVAKAAGAAKPDVATEAEVLERKNRITRGRRPARARKAFRQNL